MARVISTFAFCLQLTDLFLHQPKLPRSFLLVFLLLSCFGLCIMFEFMRIHDGEPSLYNGINWSSFTRSFLSG